MAVPGSTLLSLGLFLCLGLPFIPASSANYRDSCMSFNVVIPVTAPGIKASSEVYEGNRVYTILVPVNASITSVVLQALDVNNQPVGFWRNADQHCNSSVLYNTNNSNDGFFRASWESPPSTNITTVKIHAFAINSYKVATFSYLKLKKQGMPVTSPSMTSMTSATSATSTTSMTRQSTSRTLATTRSLNTSPALTATRNTANGIFLSPVTDAVQILLVFLTSKLLF